MTAGGPRRLRTLLAVLLATAAAPLPLFLVGACAVAIRAELGVSNAVFGAGLSGFFASAGVTAIAGGKLVHRLGWQRAMLWSAAGSVITLLAIVTVVHSFAALVVVLVFGGAALSVAIPTGSQALHEEMPPSRRALMFAIGLSSAPVATAFAGIAVPTVALRYGWRAAFAAAVVMPLLALALRPRDRVPEAAGSRTAPEPAGRGGVDGVLIGLTIAGGLGSFAIGALSGFFVLSNVDAGMTESAAGRLLAAGSVGGIIARIVAGWAVDRVRSPGLLPVAALLAVGCVGFILLATGSLTLAILAALLACAPVGAWPGVFYYGVAAHRPDAPGKATGVAQVGAAAGMVAGPTTFGMLVDHTGFGPAWIVVAVVEAAAAVAILQLARRQRRSAAARPLDA